MVNADMFKDAFAVPKKVAPAPQQPKYIPNPNYTGKPKSVVQLQPAPPVQVPVYEDPEITKLRGMVLKWLTIIIGGGAILLVAWRILLKFL